MNPEFAVELLKTMMFQAVVLAAPILVTGMVIGLCVSLFQAVTGIQEQTLTFVPKVLAILAVLVVLMPWMVRTLIGFATSVIEKMPKSCADLWILTCSNGCWCSCGRVRC